MPNNEVSESIIDRIKNSKSDGINHIICCPFFEKPKLNSQADQFDPRNEFARRTRLPVTSKKMTSYHGGGEQD